MTDIPFIAIGKGEIAQKPPLGDTVVCKNCGQEHDVEYGTSRRWNPETDTYDPPEKSTLAFVKCGEQTFLVGIEGKEI